jgi:co-chaperonin GroES (HSP10)
MSKRVVLKNRAVRGKFGDGFCTPVATRVLVTKPKPKTQTESGLLLPDGADDPENSPMGEVIAVGPEVKYLKVGDLVFLRQESMPFGTIGRDKEVGILMDEGQVLGVFEKK